MFGLGHPRPMRPIGRSSALSSGDRALTSAVHQRLIGQSGCGKSTLLSLIAGIIRPTDGEVLLGRAPVKGPNRKVGYMLQHDHLLEWRSVLDNALLGAEIQPVGWVEVRQEAGAISWCKSSPGKA
ncbi:MAG: ATP-binding cassette domain-containing protein [Xanthobacteraceae bacterium]|nr:ATP-binding cassette domain-containing protein [Xanthobacteraceae bacterium]